LWSGLLSSKPSRLYNWGIVESRPSLKGGTVDKGLCSHKKLGDRNDRRRAGNGVRVDTRKSGWNLLVRVINNGQDEKRETTATVHLNAERGATLGSTTLGSRRRGCPNCSHTMQTFRSQNQNRKNDNKVVWWNPSTQGSRGFSSIKKRRAAFGGWGKSTNKRRGRKFNQSLETEGGEGTCTKAGTWRKTTSIRTYRWN